MEHKKLENKFGQSPIFVASALVEEGGSVESGGGSSSLLSEAIHVIGCGYEEKTDWGKEVASNSICLSFSYSSIQTSTLM